MNDISYIKFGIHLMKKYVSTLEKPEDAIDILNKGIFDIYVNILMQTDELPIIVKSF
jgi:hypothetical protein